jgi:hypothetical protein
LKTISPIFPEGSDIGDKHVVPALKALAGDAIIVAASRPNISLQPVLGSLRAAKMGFNRINVFAPAVIETIVDWLEAAYGGPIDVH